MGFGLPKVERVGLVAGDLRRFAMPVPSDER